MLNHTTLNTLRQLRLPGMAQALEEQLTQPPAQALAFEERLGLLVDRELTHRQNMRLGRLLKEARLKQPACIEDIDYRAGRGLEKSQMASLASGDWIRAHQNLLICGPTGVGKSYLACALGNQACRQGLSVLYLRAPRLIEELRISHADGSYSKRLSRFAKTDLIVIDDWALSPLTPEARNDLLEIPDDRMNARSTLITSQLPVKHWHEYIGEPTLADAILDRIVHNAHQLTLKGESMRKAKNPLTDREHLE